MPRSMRKITTPAVAVRASSDEECTAESLGMSEETLKIIARRKRPTATITTIAAEDAEEEVDEGAPTLADHGGIRRPLVVLLPMPTLLQSLQRSIMNPISLLYQLLPRTALLNPSPNQPWRLRRRNLHSHLWPQELPGRNRSRINNR